MKWIIPYLLSAVIVLGAEYTAEWNELTGTEELRYVKPGNQLALFEAAMERLYTTAIPRTYKKENVLSYTLDGTNLYTDTDGRVITNTTTLELYGIANKTNDESWATGNLRSNIHSVTYAVTTNLVWYEYPVQVTIDNALTDSNTVTLRASIYESRFASSDRTKWRGSAKGMVFEITSLSFTGKEPYYTLWPSNFTLEVTDGDDSATYTNGDITGLYSLSGADGITNSAWLGSGEITVDASINENDEFNYASNAIIKKVTKIITNPFGYPYVRPLQSNSVNTSIVKSVEFSTNQNLYYSFKDRYSNNEYLREKPIIRKNVINFDTNFFTTFTTYSTVFNVGTYTGYSYNYKGFITNIDSIIESIATNVIHHEFANIDIELELQFEQNYVIPQTVPAVPPSTSYYGHADFTNQYSETFPTKTDPWSFWWPHYGVRKTALNGELVNEERPAKAWKSAFEDADVGTAGSPIQYITQYRYYNSAWTNAGINTNTLNLYTKKQNVYTQNQMFVFGSIELQVTNTIVQTNVVGGVTNIDYDFQYGAYFEPSGNSLCDPLSGDSFLRTNFLSLLSAPRLVQVGTNTISDSFEISNDMRFRGLGYIDGFSTPETDRLYPFRNSECVIVEPLQNEPDLLVLDEPLNQFPVAGTRTNFEYTGRALLNLTNTSTGIISAVYETNTYAGQSWNVVIDAPTDSHLYGSPDNYNRIIYFKERAKMLQTIGRLVPRDGLKANFSTEYYADTSGARDSDEFKRLCIRGDVVETGTKSLAVEENISWTALMLDNIGEPYEVIPNNKGTAILRDYYFTEHNLSDGYGSLVEPGAVCDGVTYTREIIYPTAKQRGLRDARFTFGTFYFNRAVHPSTSGDLLIYNYRAYTTASYNNEIFVVDYTGATNYYVLKLADRPALDPTYDLYESITEVGSIHPSVVKRIFEPAGFEQDKQEPETLVTYPFNDDQTRTLKQTTYDASYTLKSIGLFQPEFDYD